ncbi:hypothetical protein HQ533_06300 [Candidatus Woesearchaeota archaeon]|nr:hypothetical protein [Candidatus Woesearchaeota archaeon]
MTAMGGKPVYHSHNIDDYLDKPLSYQELTLAEMVIGKRIRHYNDLLLEIADESLKKGITSLFKLFEECRGYRTIGDYNAKLDELVDEGLEEQRKITDAELLGDFSWLNELGISCSADNVDKTRLKEINILVSELNILYQIVAKYKLSKDKNLSGGAVQIGEVLKSLGL